MKPFLTRGVWIASLGSLLLFAGCFGFKFTLIPQEKAKVDRAYVGDWDAVNSTDDHADLIIRNLDGKSYYIETMSKDSKVERYTGFIADVKGATFAHVRPLANDGELAEEWMLMRIKLTGNDRLQLRQLEEDFFKDKKVESAEQLRKVLEENLDNAAMYATKEELNAVRVAAK